MRQTPANEASPVSGKAAAESTTADHGSEARRHAQVVYDRSQLTEAYLEGLRRGLDEGRGGEGSRLQVNGPLAVASAPSQPAPAYADPYAYPPYYYPLVSTSFDHGRSRYLTLRMLLQDQFALDREAPFVFDERLIPPFGHPPLDVNLSPFLPRGLPHGFPTRTLVIVR